MSENQENFSINEDISSQDEMSLPLDDNDILNAVEEPKLPETQNSAIADDSVKIYGLYWFENDKRQGKY